jgi:hypothetical protein
MTQMPLLLPAPPLAPEGRACIDETHHECGDLLRLVTQDESAAEVSASLARCSLEQWQWAIRELPLKATSDPARTALRGLAAWYERMCAEDTYGDPAPMDGLDALTAQEREPGNLVLQRVVVTHWSVRVAQELAGFRRQGLAGDNDLAAASLAHAKLDLALRVAFDRVR